MKSVNTVLGPIAPEDMGVTFMHDHLIFSYPGYIGDCTIAPFDDGMRRQFDSCCKAVFEMKEAGVQTILDPTTNECGRYPEFMARVSEATGVNIICISGYYNEISGGSGYFKTRQHFFDISEEIYEMMMAEVERGVARTGIKVGALKIATSKGVITEYEKAFIKAAARVSAETQTPIISHTEEGTMGLEQLQMLKEYGADPAHIMIGHMCDDLNIDHHIGIAEGGGFVGFDRYAVKGILACPPNEQRIKLLADFIKSGYEDRCMVSQDHMADEPARVSGYVFEPHACVTIFNEVIPQLKEYGITDEQIRKMLVDNPRRLFTYE